MQFKKIISKIVGLKIHLIALAVSMCVGGFTAINLGQDVNYDLMNYHYYNPYAFLHDRYDNDIAPAQLLSYNNPLIDVPGYLLITNTSPRFSAGVLGLIQGINIWILFEIALILAQKIKFRRVYKVMGAYAIAIASFFSAGNISEVGNTMGDNLLSVFVLLALWLLMAAAGRSTHSRGSLTIMAAAYGVMGMAVGLKLTGAIYLVALFLAGMALLKGAWRAKLKMLLVQISAVVAGALLTGGYWFLRSWENFGNPVFPYYNEIFKSPYYLHENFSDERWVPSNIIEGILRPFDLTTLQTIASEQPFKDARLAVMLTLIALAVALLVLNKLFKVNIIRFDKIPKTHLVFWIFIVTSYIIWAYQFGYYRYIVPVELLSLIAITAIIFALVKNRLAAVMITAVTIVVITIQTEPINWGRVSWEPTYFGITQANFVNLENSTVLIGGYAPLSFIVPYLPPSANVIRVESDLTSPTMGTALFQEKIAAKINESKKQRKQFYALIADEDRLQAEQAFKYYGFSLGECQELAAHARKNITSKFRVCTLEE